MNQQRIPHVKPRKRKDGLWEARCRKFGRDVTGYGATRQEALEDFERKWLEYGTPAGLDQYRTVEQWWNYLQTLNLPGNERWKKTRVTWVENLVLPRLGGVPLEAVSVADGENLVAWLLNRGYAKNSAVHGIKMAKWLLDEAVRLDRLVKNKLKPVRVPVDDDPKRWLTVDEQDKLVEAANGDPQEIIVRALLSLGLRSGELSGLQWDDLNLRQRKVEVRRQLTAVLDAESKAVTSLPKYKSTRTLWFPKSLADLLSEHRERQRAESRSWKPGRWDGANFVVLNRKGAPLVKDRVREHVHRLAEAASLNDHADGAVNCQVLRRTAATRLLDDGCQLPVVSKWLGHKDIKQTMTYLRVNDERLRDLSEVVAKWNV